MNPDELRLWAAVLRRAGTLTPSLAALLLKAFAALRDSITDEEIARLMKLGAVDQIVTQLLDQATLDVVLQPVKDELRDGIIDAARAFQRQLPKSDAGMLGIKFDYLSPNTVDAIRTLESRVMSDLTADTRAMLRAVVERGMTDGTAPKALAAQLRDAIGLGPSQLEQVENFRDALQGLNGRSITDYTLRDQRFKAPTTPAQVEAQVARYRQRRIAQNAETVARTASLDAMKLGQHLSWQDAIDKGYVDGARLKKRWAGVMDDRERAAHVAMEGDVVGWNGRFSNGELIPGDSTYNCRCIAVYFLMPAAVVREVVPQNVPRQLTHF